MTVYDFHLILGKLADIKDLDEITENFNVSVSNYPSLGYKTVEIRFSVKALGDCEKEKP